MKVEINISDDDGVEQITVAFPLFDWLARRPGDPSFMFSRRDADEFFYISFKGEKCNLPANFPVKEAKP
jgi:hypothetical protein